MENEKTCQGQCSVCCPVALGKDNQLGKKFQVKTSFTVGRGCWRRTKNGSVDFECFSAPYVFPDLYTRVDTVENKLNQLQFYFEAQKEQNDSFFMSDEELNTFLDSWNKLNDK